jgi:hypothetical protein
MGPVGIAIYGSRDKASTIVPCLVAVPDARHSAVVGHIYLDCVEEFGGKCIRLFIIFLYLFTLCFSFCPSANSRWRVGNGGDVCCS